MSLIERMDAALTSVEAVRMRFTQRIAKSPDSIFLFFEDLASQSLYLPSAYAVFGREANIMCLPCAHKKEVLDFRNELQPYEEKGVKLLFFVDRDYDDLTGSTQISAGNLYVTLHYSIESYLSDGELIKAFLVEGMCHTFGDEYTAAVVETFAVSNARFMSSMLPILLVAMAHKVAGHGISYQNVNMSRLISIDNELRVERKGDSLATFKNSTLNKWQIVSHLDIARIWKRAKLWDGRQQIRGKFHLWFIIVFLEKIKLQMASAASPGKRFPFVNVPITSETLFSRMATSVPHKLDVLDFLRAASIRWGAPT